MLKRALAVLPGLGLALSLALPVLASSHVIAQKSSKEQQGSVYLVHALRGQHTYRIDVTASGRQPFAGYGTEQVVGVYKGRLYTDSPSMKLNGTTPRSFTVAQPVRGTVSEWLLAVDVQLKRGRGLTVRFVDLGGHR